MVCVTQPLPRRIWAWLIAATLINLLASVTGLVVSLYTDLEVPIPLRLALLIANFACLVVFAVKWWRWRGAHGRSTESSRQ